MTARLRCAIYTRKSTEEGLEQNFNSLHAQREACEAYVLSQMGEGWVASAKAYDDGGFSGGNIERPGLKQLLADITAGHVDIVVVYKVDRLTRSLADFAKIVELFDARGVSFVSVTQAFNTTSSMGRLTLNVLLSFAQFEREVTGERIRDKIAASKAKGLRMGGRPPLGYEIENGRLAMNEAEADRVRAIFRRYLEVASVVELEKEGVPSKRWVSRAGVERGGGMLTRGAISYLLRNSAYLGITRHKEKQYEDTHPAIVPRELWHQVQAKLDATPAFQPGTERRGDRPALEGRIFDDRGNAMVAVHTSRRGKRYRYYLSRAKLTGKGEAGSLYRISAGMIEQFLVDRLKSAISANWAGDGDRPPALNAIRTVTLAEDHILAELEVAALTSEALEGAQEAVDREGRVLRLAFDMRRRQGAMVLLAPGPELAARPKLDRALIRALVLARRWAQELEAGDVASIKAIAEREGLCDHYTAGLLPLAYLAPDLTERILEGRQGPAISLAAITRKPLPMDWREQRVHFIRLGMPQG